MTTYKTYQELCDYFEEIVPAEITAIKAATVGWDEEILDSQSGHVKYPHFRVDTPEITFLNEGQADEITSFRFRIFVLKHEPKRTAREQNPVLSEMLSLLKSIRSKMYADAEADLFDLVDGNDKGDAIRAWSADNCFGWFCFVTINLYTSTCD